MTETQNTEHKHVAVLIDAENVTADLADQVFTQASALGEISAKEIFGTATALTSWIEPTLKYAIHPNLTVKASKGKNSSDLSLVIGAMDLLIHGGIETAVIVSSDSDFSTLSVRLRTAGIHVVGMGAEKANPLWRTSCSSFIVLSEKKAAPAPAAQPKPAVQQQAAKPAPKPVVTHLPTHDERLVNIRSRIASLLAAENGSMTVNKLFQNLNKFHDYQVDQAGSKRKPLNYLTWAFGKDFHFEETPNGMMISANPLEDTAAREAAFPTPVETVQPEAVQLEPVQAASAEKGNMEKPLQASDASADPVPQNSAVTGAEQRPTAVEMTVEKTDEAPVEAETTANQELTARPAKPNAKRPSNRRQPKTNADRKSRQASPADPHEALRKTPISEQKDIPARIRKALIDSGRTTLGDAALISDEELRQLPSVGEKTIARYRETISKLLNPTTHDPE